ncbi:S-layer homology domain-containing protein [Tumebacillus sp. ITR2]|uniref:S-layer homology domain-containing protein n=1 Tax=Tumebacillus amylolyticus TaxID=2801339 RepID=A0ABS1J815_9BACL|nr:S-layer homology domain-containing protein [Tumebacillus amylolyticus]
MYKSRIWTAALASLLALSPLGALSATAADAANSNFPDVPKSYWASDAILKMREAGVVNGATGSDGVLYFNPNGSVTRAEFAKMITDALHLTKSTSAQKFHDVGAHWGASYISAATDGGLIFGYEDSTYRPENRITREEMAVMLQRAIRHGNLADKPESSFKFNDDSSISDWARQDVYQAYQRALPNITDNNFEPRRNATRAEAAYMIYKTLNALNEKPHPVQETNGIKQITAVKNGHIALFDGTNWNTKFWNGVNLGATTPGHYPGELSPTKQDYLRWFQQMKAMNVDLVRVYTILPPYFYEALDEFNAGRTDPLYFLQGIWSPEEELIADGNGADALSSAITNQFKGEIVDAVHAVHGDLSRPVMPGHAYGTFRTDASKYLAGWLLGTEWFPNAVKLTNDNHPGMQPYSGTYFAAKANATPFESWLAQLLDTVGTEEMKFGWQHPVAFTNWVTADPLKHPEEPFPEEDMVSVDPTHLGNTDKWSAGYYAAYHAYPYYPDFLRFDSGYQTYKDSTGAVNPYAGYLHDLKKQTPGLPIMVAEFGVPSSRGMAHRGPLDRNQGMHTEQEQGQIDADLQGSIYNEGYDGGFVFSWQDEWFKYTWNTMSLTMPRDRRAFWFNRLTNEANFGVVEMEPGKTADDVIRLDGETSDWAKRANKTTASYPGFDLSVSHDEAYLYLLAQKKSGNWDFSKETFTAGFDVLGGGSATADKAPGVTFKSPVEFLLQVKGDNDGSRLYVNSAYDQHTFQYAGKSGGVVPFDPSYQDAAQGKFLPWKLALSYALKLPQSGKNIPFEDLDVGIMKTGQTSLSDWYAKGNVLEVRIPWMMLGYTDPSSLQVWDYPYSAGKLQAAQSPGVTVEPLLRANTDTAPVTVDSTPYTWAKWDVPTYHERLKDSYYILQNAFKNYKQPK